MFSLPEEKFRIVSEHHIANQGSGVQIKTWAPASEIEPQAIEQIQRLASMPGVVGHVAVMPDVHAGKGSTIGTVYATKDIIIPATVGVDIGCGMCALKLNIKKRSATC
jgi:tRNA-splicing ligase RtcB